MKENAKVEHKYFGKSDPNVVQKLQKCPICREILAFSGHFTDHITEFHRIPMEDFEQLGLKVEEFSVSELVDFWLKGNK